MKIANNIIDLRSSNDTESIILGENKFINIASSEYRPQYEVLEYIQLDGTQYFNLGFKSQLGTGYEMGVQFDDLGSAGCGVCGSRDNSSASENNIGTFVGSSTSVVSDYNNSSYSGSRYTIAKSDLSTSNWYDVYNYRTGRGIRLNGTEVGTPNTTTATTAFTTVNDFYLGGYNGFNLTPFKGKIRYFKSVSPALDLIPVLDDKLKPCFYDKISKRFYYHSNTGTSTTTPVYKRWNKYNVDYIKNDTNSYIKTGVIDENEDLSFEADFTYFSGSGYQYVLGAYGGDSYKNTVLYINSSNSIGAWVNKGYSQTAMLPNIVETNARIKCYADTTKSIINENTVTTFVEGTERTGAELYIFRRNGDGGSTQPQSTSNAIIGLHSLKINIGDVTVRDYEPSVRTNNNTTIVFLYDKVYNKAYDNAGSGSFIAGA